MSNTTVTTDTPRSETGQFTSGEQLTGQAALERDAGFVPMEKPKEEPEEITTREAAEKMRSIEELSGSGPIVTHTSGLGPNVTLTVEQAAAMVNDARDADDNQAAIDADKALKKEVDELRGETPETKQPQLETEPDIEKVLSHPKVKEAITAKVTEAETQRAAYEAAIQENGKAQIAAIAADFPELMNLPLNQWAAAINAMHQREPGRARQVFARLQALAQVEAASQQLKAQKAARDQADFKTYAAKEDARYAELTKGIPAKEMAAIEAHVPKMLAEHGADVQQFLKAVGNQSTFPRGAAEALLVKAARYDLLMKTVKAAPARPPVPMIQKPGNGGPRVDRGAADLASLNAKLSKSGNIKDAAALLLARRGRR